MQYQQLNLGSNLFSMGNILGTSGAQDLLKTINQQAGFGSSYFGSENDPFKDSYMHFMSTVIQPIRDVRLQLHAANATVQREDKYVEILSEEDLKAGVPPCMYDGILTFGPIRELAQDGRIEAFGIDVNNYPIEDEYGRLIQNGRVDLIPENIVDGMVELVWEWKTTDPIVTDEELDILDTTRRYLHEFIMDEETMHLDPTSIPALQLRG